MEEAGAEEGDEGEGVEEGHAHDASTAEDRADAFGARVRRSEGEEGLAGCACPKLALSSPLMAA